MSIHPPSFTFELVHYRKERKGEEKGYEFWEVTHKVLIGNGSPIPVLHNNPYFPQKTGGDVVVED